MDTGTILLPSGHYYTLGGSSGYLTGGGGSYVEDLSEQTIDMVGIASTVAFGSFSFDYNYTLDMAGIPSTVAFGAFTIAPTYTLEMVGIPSTVAFGAPTIDGPPPIITGDGTIYAEDSTVQGLIRVEMGIRPLVHQASTVVVVLDEIAWTVEA